MKVIALDCDGVVNSRRSIATARSRDSDPVGISVDPYMMLLVIRICDITGSKIVVSSSWRHSNLAMKYLTDNLRSLRDGSSLVIGKTPLMENEWCRGHEIKDWLDRHPEVTRYAVLDDDRDAGVGHGENFFKTTFEAGLTEEIAAAVTEHLSHGIPEPGDVPSPEK